MNRDYACVLSAQCDVDGNVSAMPRKIKIDDSVAEPQILKGKSIEKIRQGRSFKSELGTAVVQC